MCTCYAAHQGPLIGIINILILILIVIRKTDSSVHFKHEADKPTCGYYTMWTITFSIGDIFF